MTLSKDTELGIGLYGDPEEYANLAVYTNPCPGCGRDVTLDPIANVFTLVDVEVVCDECARTARVDVFDLVDRVRQLVPLSILGIAMFSMAVIKGLADDRGEDWNVCDHCEEPFDMGQGDYFLCDKATRRPICDACAGLLGSTELVDVLRKLREQKGGA